MAFLFGPSCEIEIDLADLKDRKQLTLIRDNKKEKIPLYIGNETVKGAVKILPTKKKKLDIKHNGVKIFLIGQIEMFYDRGNQHEFVSAEKELAPPGEIKSEQVYKFEFPDVERQYESYNGVNVRLRYFLRVLINVKKSITNVVKELDFWVHNYQLQPETNNTIKMEVGIEDCLHIEFEYNKSKYHMRDIIIGKIYFILVRIKIKHMQLSVIKRESTGSGPNLYNESETLIKYEIMDGAPVKGESIPIRLFLSAIDSSLTPSYRNIHNKFSVKYYLNLVLIDEEDRRYFKQQEIILWRREKLKTNVNLAPTTKMK